MANYIPNTPTEQEQMLHQIGYTDRSQLMAGIPEEALYQAEFELPPGLPEMEVGAKMKQIAEKNRVFPKIFRGAGAYWHYIPPIVEVISQKEEFLTAYTPYQPEISQGILQSIYEYQTDICELTGMDVANASAYDGASATAEAVTMCLERKKRVIYLSETVDPKIISTVRTYAYGRDLAVHLIPASNGITDIAALEKQLTDTACCLILQQPNYYGIMEPAEAIAQIVHQQKARLVMNCNPIALGILQTPRQSGADIAVGEGQPLGIPLSYGGPYLGFMATTQALYRRLPGRIVGQTEDGDHNRGFVLTLQAREQHIRREKASSNLCSNQANCALRAGIYLAAIGSRGLAKVATLCTSKAHYLQTQLEKVGLPLVYQQPFFHEFVTSCRDSQQINAQLAKHGILGGLPLGPNQILWCTTEQNRKQDIDQLVQIVAEVEKQ